MIVLGRITAPYGVRGWLKLHPFGDDPAAWGDMRRWWMGSDDQEFSGWRSFSLHTMRSQGKGWVVKLVGIDDRQTAESLVGQFVGAPRGEMPATGPDEYYWADLLGLAVVNDRQEALGRVAEMVEAGAHAVMVVREGEGETATERLIPFVGAVVKSVDISGGVVRVEWEKDW